MNALESLRRLAAEQGRDRLLHIGAATSAVWLALVALAAWLAPQDQARGLAAWLIWVLSVLLPLALIWFGVWSARSLAALRLEAGDLRAALEQMRAAGGPGAEPQQMLRPAAAPIQRIPAPPPRPVAEPRAAAERRPAPRPPADARQARLELDTPDAPELTPTELYFALNFPDGPDDREAIRCLRLALADPGMARLIRAAQDVVTLLAGQGVYMDDVRVPETEPALWRGFAQGMRGEAVAGLAVIRDDQALDTASAMLREDEVFRDVAHHFLRHFDRLLTQRAETDDATVLAVLAETRSGRAFILLAQATGILGPGREPPPEAEGDR